MRGEKNLGYGLKPRPHSCCSQMKADHELSGKLKAGNQSCSWGKVGKTRVQRPEKVQNKESSKCNI